MWNGARLTNGGVWTNASSRALKEAIRPLEVAEAESALAALSPVRYVYRNSRDEEYIGFIAEDVPDLVATNDRKSLSPMDIAAVLTAVVKSQRGEIDALQAALTRRDERLEAQAAAISALQAEMSSQRDQLARMEKAANEERLRVEHALAAQGGERSGLLAGVVH